MVDVMKLTTRQGMTQSRFTGLQIRDGRLFIVYFPTLASLRSWIGRDTMKRYVTKREAKQLDPGYKMNCVLARDKNEVIVTEIK